MLKAEIGVRHERRHRQPGGLYLVDSRWRIPVSTAISKNGRRNAAGCQPTTAPRDAEWGERFFHLIDPDGHELSFARPLRCSV